jgi:hypothetical protein
MTGQYAALARLLALLVAAAGLFFAGWYVNGLRHERNALEADAGRQEALNAEIAKERERADGFNEELKALLREPKAGTTIREIVRNAPSNCVRPAAVSDGLQSAIQRANQAIAAGTSGDPLPANPASPKD